MDILLPAIQSRTPLAHRLDDEPATQSVSEHDDPAFRDLIRRVTQRIAALGATAPESEIDDAALWLVQDIARYTLAWVEPEGFIPTASPRIDMHSNTRPVNA